MPTRMILAAFAALMFAASAVQATELKLANFMSPNHPYEAKVFAAFADKVAAETGGAVTVRVYSGGELGGGPVQQYNRAVDGVADIVFGLPGYTASNFPLTLLSELPGVVSEDDATAAVQANLDHLNDEYKRVVLVGLWTNGQNVLFMRDKPVRSLADLKGLKIRVPSKNAGRVVEAWGATPVSMPVPEIYNSMQTGVIDGAFIDGTATAAFKLQEVTDYITTGMNGTISSFFLVMNRDVFRDLSKEHQEAVLKAGSEISQVANGVQLAGVKAGLKRFADAEGKELIVLSPDAAAEFNARTAPIVDAVIAEYEAEGLPAITYVEALRGE